MPGKGSTISHEKYMEIVRMLDEKAYTIRAIARVLAVSRQTVHNVKNGAHAYQQPPKPPKDRLPCIPRSSRPRKCPECGNCVHLPCLICSTRRYAENRKKLDYIEHLLTPD